MQCVDHLPLYYLAEASERADPTAVGLLTLCKTYKFVATLMLMSDILSHVNKLSLLFQMETIDFSTVNSLVETCIKEVKKLKSNPGPAMKSTDSVIKHQEEQQIPISGLTERNKKHFKDEIQDKYCNVLVEHLEKRFPDLPLIKSFQLFDPKQIPSSLEEIETCGDNFISELCDHYNIDNCTGKQEWQSLRSLMRDKEFKDKTPTQILKSLSSNDSLRTIYPVLSRFSQIALTLPVSNADAERGFSCMNRVKTELRNRLTVSSLDSLLRISMEGPENNFDFNAAVLKWSTIRNCRIF